MPERNLLIDQGNSRLKWLWADGERLDTDSHGSGDTADFEAAARKAEAPPDRVLLSSVASDEAAGVVADRCRALWNVEVERLRTRSEQGGVRNGYAEPGQLGVDRWLAIVGAACHHGRPVVIWDLGTATTLDAVDVSGQYLGGHILPGPETMLRSLRRDTMLRVPEQPDLGQALGDSGVAPGDSTARCISHGVLAAQLGALNQFVRHLSARFDRDPRIVATGGAAREILPLLQDDILHDPWLVFRGMLID